MHALDRCVVCDSPRIRERFRHRVPQDGSQWWVFECGRCGHGFLNPRPTWDELAPYYGAAYTPHKTSNSPELHRHLLNEARLTGELFHVPVRPEWRLLDVGCANGEFLRLCRELGMTVEGVEPGDQAADRARGLGLKVFTGTVEEFASIDDRPRFDLITANHVLEHVPDPVAALAAMRRLLAPGGTIAIAVPNAGCWAARQLGGRWHSADLPRHLMHFTPTSLAEAGRRAGLGVTASFTRSVTKGVASSIRTTLRRRLLIPRALSTKLKLIDDVLAPFVTCRLDARSGGEALFVRFHDAAGVEAVPTPERLAPAA